MTDKWQSGSGEMRTERIWFIMLSLAIVALIVILITAAINAGRVDAWLVRAKDAGTPTQVSEFLTAYKNALTDEQYVEGKYTSIFHYPATKMSVYLRTVDGLIQRAGELSRQSAVDTSYQMGLLNLEKDLGDIETAAFSVWLASGGVWIVIVLILFSVTWIVLGFVLMVGS